VSLAEAIAALLAARGMRGREFADSIADTHAYMTAYRLLSGQTRDPQITTVLDVCEVLRISPNELLQLAGLLESPAGTTSPLDMPLRQIFSEVQALGEDDRRLLLSVIRGIVADRRRQARPSARRHRGATGEDGTPA
jgi:DNA-binding Xre family transcriptional regulator